MKRYDADNTDVRKGINDDRTGTETSTAPITTTGHKTSTAKSSQRGSSKSLPVISPIKPRTSRTISSVSSDPRPFARSLNSSSGPLCRICHMDGTHEQLLSPCYCSGTIGLLHLTCLQKWLGTANKTVCELCNFQFTLRRKPKAFHKYIKNPGTERDRKQLIFDIVCLFVLTPLTLLTSFLCIHGSTYFLPSQPEFIGLVLLTACLLILYFMWLTVCARQNLTKWKKWKTFNHEVKLVCKAPHDNVKNDSVENRHRQSLDGNTSRLSASSCPKSPPRKSLNIRSIEIKILTDSRSFLQSNTKGHMSSSEERKRRHETIPHMSKLLGERNPCSASNGTGSERLHSDDQLSSSVGVTGGRRLKECDDDEERDVHVSTWVMSSSEFREAYDRSRSPKSSQNESFHTALQSPRGALIPMGTRHTGPPGSACSVVNEIETKNPVNECRCLVNSPVQFTDKPAGQDNDRFRWTQMVAKETYI